MEITEIGGRLVWDPFGLGFSALMIGFLIIELAIEAASQWLTALVAVLSPANDALRFILFAAMLTDHLKASAKLKMLMYGLCEAMVIMMGHG